MPIPDADNVAELVDQITAHWPSRGEDVWGFFQSVGLRPNHNTVDGGTFFTSLAGNVTGDWRFDGRGLAGVTLFLYSSTTEYDPETLSGYQAVRARLVDRFGAPTEEWGDARVPACRWEAGRFGVDLHCASKGSSLLMVGVTPSASDIGTPC